MNTISHFTISNGLTVIHVPRPKSSNISLSLRVIAGSVYESDEEIGVAHFLEHIVFDGTKKYPTEKQLAEIIDERGGFRNASTNKETIEYSVKVLKEDVEIAFDCLSQMIIYPLMREESVKKQKKIIEQEILRFKNDPEKFASRLIYSALFPGTRMGGLNTGDIDDIKKINRAGIVSYLERTHCARNMALSICGNVSKEDSRMLIERYFGKIRSGNKILPVNIRVKIRKEPLVEIGLGLKQAVLSIGYQGFNTADQNRYATDLLSQMLLQGKSSRLKYEIREKRALAYSVGGNNYNGRNNGAFTVQVGLAEENITECLNIIKDELKRISLEPISENELNKAYAFIKSGMAFSFENSLLEASYYSNQWCMTGCVPVVDGELNKYKIISQDGKLVQETAARLFSPPPAILIIRAGKDIG